METDQKIVELDLNNSKILVQRHSTILPSQGGSVIGKEILKSV